MRTWRRYQHFGLAAVEAVQQGLGADVVIEKSHGRAQFSQSQPGKQEGGFIPHEECDGVSGSVTRVSLERVGYFVTPVLRAGVRVPFILKHNERLVWMRGGLLQETIQDEEERSPPSPWYEPH